MRKLRLAEIAFVVTSLVGLWLGDARLAWAQRASSRETTGGVEQITEENRSVVRNRASAARSTGTSSGSSTAPRSSSRTSTATRLRQAPQAPELLDEQSAPAPRRSTAGRGDAPVPEGYAVDPESGDLVDMQHRHDGHAHDAEYADFDGHHDCAFCGGDGCDLCSGGFLTGFAGGYVRLEYLAWNLSALNLPPLVTTSPNGTARPQAGVLGTPGVEVLYGGNGVNDTMRSGGRVTVGAWLDQCQRNALELDYFVLSAANDGYTATSTGDPILARPFFDAAAGRESAELVAFPNVITGTVTVATSTQLQGAGVRMRHVLCCGEDCGPSLLSPMPQPGGYRYEVLLGYRTVSLADSVSITENLTAITPAGAFLLNDDFRTNNEFHGIDLGMAMQWRRGRWTTDLQSRVAFGNTHSSVGIAGNTQITSGANTQNFNGGLLAQRTNIGNYDQDFFSVVPEIGITLGYDLTPNLRVLVGYSLLYWSRVARAGDQISLDVNPNLIPPEAVPFTGPLRPAFSFVETDFWAYGVNAGIEGRF